MNKELAQAVEHGIDAGTFEHGKGFCLRAMRQGGEVLYGSKYDRLFRGDGTQRDATAARAGVRFLKAGLGFYAHDAAEHGGLQAGDLLVKTNVAKNRWGDYSGHIGCLMMDLKRVGENSSTPVGRVHGALGYRTLPQFKAFDIVVRLPSPVEHVAAPAPVHIAAPSIDFEGHAIGVQISQENGVTMAPLRGLCEALGYRVVFDKTANRVHIERESV